MKHPFGLITNPRDTAAARFLVTFAILSAICGAAHAARPDPHADAAKAAAIGIPTTPLASKAEKFVREVEPPFLFNHSVRTYVFGAIRLRARGRKFDLETAYVAALFHDIGLLPRFSTPNSSFEIDGANAAERFVRQNGGSEAQARTIWNAIVMHDMGGAYQLHQSNEALLVGAGAGGDVDGIDPKAISATSVSAVISRWPRLNFKTQFTSLAVDHCRRKPASQIGWLDILCREVAPNKDRGSVREEIASSPFSE